MHKVKKDTIYNRQQVVRYLQEHGNRATTIELQNYFERELGITEVTRTTRYLRYTLDFLRKNQVLTKTGTGDIAMNILHPEKWEELEQAGLRVPKGTIAAERMALKKEYKDLTEDTLNLLNAMVRELSGMALNPKLKGYISKSKDLVARARILEERELEQKVQTKNGAAKGGKRNPPELRV